MNDLNSKSMNRRTVLIAAAGAAPLLAICARSAQAAGLAQSAIGYQNSPGKNGHQCDGCNLFITPNACKTVEGVISPTGWCKLWINKAK
jgi:hypothetical protein